MIKMELKILGTVSPYAKGNHNCPGFLVTNNGYKVLLDCGNGSTRLLNFPEDLYNLNVIISHLHKDHYGDLLTLGYASYVYHNLKQLEDKVNVYLPSNKSDWFASYPYDYDISADFNKWINDYISLDYELIKRTKEAYWNISSPYNEKSKLKIGDIDISFMKTVHMFDESGKESANKSFATKLTCNNQSIVYTSDMGYSSAKDIIEFAKDTDILIIEASMIREFNNPNMNTHLHAYQAAEIGKLANAKRVILNHFWPETDTKKYLYEAKEVYDRVEIAEEGNQYVLRGNKIMLFLI
jgi:ribonuclease BN (tRNA processing enzyme)